MRTETLDVGYLALPESSGPGVVLIHDVWGLSDHTRDLARRFASQGFVTLAVDLYRGLGKVDISDPGEFMRGLSDPDLVVTIQRAVDTVARRPEVTGRGVGVVGFCMGGTYALFAGALVNGVSAIAPFYCVLSHRHGLYHSEHGLDPAKKPLEPILAAERLRVPLIAFFGDQDPYVPLEDVRQLERMVLSMPGSEVHVYAGAGHAFANDTRPAAHRPEAARDALARTWAFLHRHLGAAEGA